ncbi:UDP-2,3-diacylglucosamine diphosphatase [Marinospirillum insulare]|uniref:UDP-2,3-diacylglucosamine hydrolase n=1 Tax=Marinospirillum insulare TaxID=217169 RepID=A0ABQ5ZZ21_9GAMM|nr:UDP-2,3-diacylglucosamine diphosphatase [Marinospirillum insulare]GLR64538.1 UDP-2,3-diacylglucosamine hydrolase [Marinospirillum insulare]
MLLFISDMHLQEDRPVLTRAFLQFLKTDAVQAQKIYLLGDIFNYWVGDDAMTVFHKKIAGALKQLAEQGTQVFIMQGNRDFALGESFCKQASCTLLKDPSVITPFGQPILLMHGDLLCTQDVGYQRMRRVLHNPIIKYLLLNLPLKLRLKIADKARQISQSATRKKASYIVDVTQQEVVRRMEKHQTTCLIHGHTHRPAVHNLQVEIKGKKLPAKRYVLGDWSDQQGWKITLEKDDIQLSEFSFSGF